MKRILTVSAVTAVAVLTAMSLRLSAQETPVIPVSVGKMTVPGPKAPDKVRQRDHKDSGSIVSVETMRPDEPVDLSVELILRGDDSAGSVFSRHRISPPDPLDSAAISAIEMKSVEQDLAIPLRPYPEPDEPPVHAFPIWAEGTLGLHTTTGLKAGVSGTSWPFDYNLSGQFSATSGFIEGAEENSAGLRADAGYVIGEGYGMFSGGYMGGEAAWNSHSYGLYAIPEAPGRIHDFWNLATDGEAETRGIEMRGKAGFRRTTLRQSGNHDALLSESSLDGSLSAERETPGLGWGAAADVHITNNSLGSVSDGRLEGFGTLTAGILKVRGGASASFARGTDDATDARIAPKGEVRLQPLGAILLNVGVTGGVRQVSLQNSLAENPYLSIDSDLLPVDERLAYHAGLKFEPLDEMLSLAISGRRSEYRRYAHFAASASGQFPLVYSAATVDRIEGSAAIRLGVTDAAVHVRYTDGHSQEGARLPWIPKWDAEAYLTHRLPLSPISGTVTARFIGARPDANGDELSEALLVGVEADYALLPILDLFLQGRNLLNTEYQLWNGYRERGIFLALGARLRL